MTSGRAERIRRRGRCRPDGRRDDDGDEDSRRLPVLRNGDTPAKKGVDAEHLDTRRFQIEEICRDLKVFPQMVGYADKTATFASAEAFFLAHVIHTLNPWIENWEQSLARDLFPDEDDVVAKFSMQGLLRGDNTEVVKCISNDLQVPASAEFVLEGYLEPGEMAPEGPYGDHTGYYNEIDSFPVFTVTHITHREQPIYHSTYTGRPPDEPAILGVALNEVFIPLLQKQFPEIVDFYLPPEGCSYRLAVVTMKKQYPGHAKRVMMGVWSFLRQFMYTKFVIVCDDDINARDWQDVIWAITTRMDPARDTLLIENTPIDYLDFASPVSGLGSKMGMDATNKWPGETTREWGEPIVMREDVKQKVDEIWDSLGIVLPVQPRGLY